MSDPTAEPIIDSTREGVELAIDRLRILAGELEQHFDTQPSVDSEVDLEYLGARAIPGHRASAYIRTIADELENQPTRKGVASTNPFIGLGMTESFVDPELGRITVHHSKLPRGCAIDTYADGTVSIKVVWDGETKIVSMREFAERFGGGPGTREGVGPEAQAGEGRAQISCDSFNELGLVPHTPHQTRETPDV